VLTVEEKIDGANLGIWLDDATNALVTRNRYISPVIYLPELYTLLSKRAIGIKSLTLPERQSTPPSTE